MTDIVTPRFKTPPKKRPTKRNDAAWRRACQDVDSRSRGWCEANVEGVCQPGRHKAQEHHHIRLRSQGGPDEAWNLLHICNAVHDWAHNVDRARAEQLGIIQRRTA